MVKNHQPENNGHALWKNGSFCFKATFKTSCQESWVVEPVCSREEQALNDWFMDLAPYVAMVRLVFCGLLQVCAVHTGIVLWVKMVIRFIDYVLAILHWF